MRNMIDTVMMHLTRLKTVAYNLHELLLSHDLLSHTQLVKGRIPNIGSKISAFSYVIHSPIKTVTVLGPNPAKNWEYIHTKFRRKDANV